MSGILQGDCRDILPTLDAGSVHCVVTSPPYWGLRDYGTASWDGGNPECGHRSPSRFDYPLQSGLGPTGVQTQASNAGSEQHTVYRDTCGKCGARRIDRQLGLEPTPDEYVANIVAVFREVRRVLRDDGTVWLNLGDSYYRTGVGNVPQTKNPRVDFPEHTKTGSSDNGVGRFDRPGTRAAGKSKDLVGIPWRVAFALQADGWYLRSDIIWHKPNAMPESVTDRPTKSHEYVFLLSKRERYYFDADAVREPHIYGGARPSNGAWTQDEAGRPGPDGAQHLYGHPAGRNIRSVWNIATQPYPGAHFATFPEALVVPCIKAGTSERGVCAECGAPWERVVERGFIPHQKTYAKSGGAAVDHWTGGGGVPGWSTAETTGWRHSCAHDAPTVPAVVLDPFAGSGTVGRVAEKLSRRAVLIELSPDYVELAEARTAQMGLTL